MRLLRNTFTGQLVSLRRTVAEEHGFKNWHDFYIERLRKWPCTVLNDGGLTGEVLCWRGARWSANELLKGRQAIRGDLVGSASRDGRILL